ncbi:hypothetical protein P4O66_009888 [Electrophorus voltai]|uniref:SH3 domain-containing protein n=1 Tax=Electrophorus voltai TaxID=2609070 RepID=A0AAD8ZBH3_9TELE|nr:hypothetical protein P4O66_009888 [Electrophorus voltai]
MRVNKTPVVLSRAFLPPRPLRPRTAGVANPLICSSLDQPHATCHPLNSDPTRRRLTSGPWRTLSPASLLWPVLTNWRSDLMCYTCRTSVIGYDTEPRVRTQIKITAKLQERWSECVSGRVSFSQAQVGIMNGRAIPNPPHTQAPLSLPPHIPPYSRGACPASSVFPGLSVSVSLYQLPSLWREVASCLLSASLRQDLLNHCFEDIEVFMGKLQKTAEAQSVLEQRNKRRKSHRKKSTEDDLLSEKAKAPPEAEFIQIFQKFKNSFSLLIVKATGGPSLATSVTSPALTTGAVDLLKNTITLQEHTLWNSLGPYWTYPRSMLRGPIPPYSPVFLDGWRLPGSEVEGWVDPVEAQHSKDAEREKVNMTRTNERDKTRQDETYLSEEMQCHQLLSRIQMKYILTMAQRCGGTVVRTVFCLHRDGGVPLKERHYRCSYDFVARNSSELSVLQGETLEVIESSKRWWKCRNRFHEVGFVPFNILEPVTHIESPKAPALPSLMKTTPMAPPSPHAVTSHPNSQRPRSIALAPQHLPDDTEKVMQVNDELLQRLTNGKAATPRPLVIPRSVDTSVPLDYHSPPAEVEAWLHGKGFSDPTVQCLRVLTGAQLFSLNKEELRAVIPDEGARVYSQLTVQKTLLELSQPHTVRLDEPITEEKIKLPTDPNTATAPNLTTDSQNQTTEPNTTTDSQNQTTDPNITTEPNTTRLSEPDYRAKHDYRPQNNYILSKPDYRPKHDYRHKHGYSTKPDYRLSEPDYRPKHDYRPKLPTRQLECENPLGRLVRDQTDITTTITSTIISTITNTTITITNTTITIITTTTITNTITSTTNTTSTITTTITTITTTTITITTISTSTIITTTTSTTTTITTITNTITFTITTNIFTFSCACEHGTRQREMLL